jgi:hypothetical protein
MKKTILPILLLLLVPLSAGAQSYPEVNMKEGLWEITAEFKVPGMPVTIPPVTHQQCITKKDLATAVNQAGQGTQECRPSNLSITNSTVVYDITCNSGGTTTQGHAELTYSGDHMQGSMKLSGPQGMETTTVFTGHRIGDCR